MWMYFWFLFPILLVIPAIIVAGFIYVMMGMATSDVFTAFGKRTTSLTCWHCGQKTPANRKFCKHCNGELQ